MSVPGTSTISAGHPTKAERGLDGGGQETVDAVSGAGSRPATKAEADVERGLAVPEVPTATTTPERTREPDPAGRYADEFLEAIYDIDDAEKKGHLSRRLTVVYADGAKIKIGFDEIGDEIFAEFSANGDFFFVGRGGRTFPRVMNRGTMANLWYVKQQALIMQQQFDAEFLLLLSMSMVAISFVLPSPTAGLPWGFRVSSPGNRPLSHKLYAKIDRGLNNLNRRLGKPHIPEEPPLPSGFQPKSQSSPKPAVPVAVLPNGAEIPPDHYGTVFHGNHEISPEAVVRAGGIPAKTGAGDPRLYEHTASGANSKFRGVTPFLRAPAKDAGQGAAEYAVHGADVGYAYEIRGAPVWELGQHLQGRVPEPLVGFRSSRPGVSGEVESVTESRVLLEHIRRVWRVTRVEGNIQVEELNWGVIKATTKTSDIPSSL